MIWCVDDDSTIRDIEVYTLTQTGFEAKGFPDGLSMLEALKTEKPELIVLDIMMAGMDGVEVLKEIRSNSETRKIPVIMATAKGTEMDKIQGLDTGADDYLVKPFGVMEMVSRIKAVLRRCAPEEIDEVLRIGEIVLDDKKHAVSVSGEKVTLTYKEFEILKFRSMIVDAEKYTGAVLASEDDPRITKVGKFLRAHRIDELPQLLNILKGDMSIVGPRPERKVIADEYCKDIPEFAYRTKVRGGVTGYAQIYGKYNTSAYDKLRLDLMYIENYSLLLDIKLIILTLRIIFSKDSTEGIDKQQEIQQKIEELFRQMEEE